jgi:hypothetical protein
MKETKEKDTRCICSATYEDTETQLRNNQESPAFITSKLSCISTPDEIEDYLLLVVLKEIYTLYECSVTIQRLFQSII